MLIVLVIIGQFMQFPVLHFGLAHSGSRPFNLVAKMIIGGVSYVGVMVHSGSVLYKLTMTALDYFHGRIRKSFGRGS